MRRLSWPIRRDDEDAARGQERLDLHADSPATPGPDPMCMDANAAKWAMAWIGKQPPPANTVGVMYMLEGGTDASNTDPYATARPPTTTGSRPAPT